MASQSEEDSGRNLGVDAKRSTRGEGGGGTRLSSVLKAQFQPTASGMPPTALCMLYSIADS
eukprot:6708006-Prymnesium_polylepis.1